MSAEEDHLIEVRRYNARATELLANPSLHPDGSAGIDPELRRPYVQLEDILRNEIKPGARTLDLCCGDGVHSIHPARLGAQVTAADIAEQNLRVAQVRAVRAGVPLTPLIANAEDLPLPDQSFDVVFCVGSLSYVDLELFLRGVKRVLRPGGAFIFVDSLNHNPIYRLNRWRHYRRGERSLSTLERMPTMATLRIIRREFPDLQISYHGIFSFLIPLLRWLKPEVAARWLDRADRALPFLRRYAFKIVGVGHNPAAR